MPGNLLGNETSPYLLQHASNPVNWRPWGPEALADARNLDRPILLSIGYAACHWCHVMAHESFEDPETAEVMNRLFINIKVDREERPDVDHIYMSALQALGQQGGWPLTMFLTPSAEPVWGGTYFPNTAKYGRPAFVDVLHSVAKAFTNDPAGIEANRSALIDRLREPAPSFRAAPGPNELTAAAELVAGMIDPERGGLRGSPKFPQPALTEFLWRTADRTGTSRYRDLVLVTLRNMVQGGIYDHIGGGLSRYSVDQDWLVPHFEKMLYDNALLLSRLTAAWLATGEPLFRIRIEETIGWLSREMSVDGAFASSLDADSEGEEGTFYVWRPAEIADLLGPASDQFSTIYDITDKGNFEGASIPNRLKSMALLSEKQESRLANYRAVLLEARNKRPRPARDDKVLADWNGLMIAALTEAGRALDRPDWVEMAKSTYRLITESMIVDGRLRHSMKDGRVLGVGFASDHAALVKAAVALHQTTQSTDYLHSATSLIESLDRHYWDSEVRAYRMSSSDEDDLLVRPLPVLDDSVPSANAIIAMSLVRLASLTGNDHYQRRADDILVTHSGQAEGVLGRASLFSALDQQLTAVDIVIVAPDGTDPASMVDELRKVWRDSFTLSVVTGTDAIPDNHPASGKTAVNGVPTAYVCRGQTCSAPVTRSSLLADLLAEERNG